MTPEAALLFLLYTGAVFAGAYPLGRWVERREWKRCRNGPVPGAYYILPGVPRPVEVAAVYAYPDIVDYWIDPDSRTGRIVRGTLPIRQWLQVARPHEVEQ